MCVHAHVKFRYMLLEVTVIKNLSTPLSGLTALACQWLFASTTFFYGVQKSAQTDYWKQMAVFSDQNLILFQPRATRSYKSYLTTSASRHLSSSNYIYRGSPHFQISYLRVNEGLDGHSDSHKWNLSTIRSAHSFMFINWFFLCPPRRWLLSRVLQNLEMCVCGTRRNLCRSTPIVRTSLTLEILFICIERRVVDCTTNRYLPFTRKCLAPLPNMSC